MDRPQIVELIRSCLEAVNRERPAGERVVVDERTPLLGDGSPFDSLEFVSFSTDLESRLAKSTGRDFALVAAALSAEDHPFEDVTRLADHIERRLRG